MINHRSEPLQIDSPGLLKLKNDLRVAVICPNSHLRAGLLDMVAKVPALRVTRVLEEYPDAPDLQRLLRARVPQLVFISLESFEHVQAALRVVDSTSSGMQVIAVHAESSPELLMRLMQEGVRELLTAPFDQVKFVDAVLRAANRVLASPTKFQVTDKLYTFLPSKAGVGATTLAVNTAMACAAETDAHPLLCDFDLNSGLVRFLLQLAGAASMVDAASMASKVDENLWPQLVSSVGALDVIHAGKPNPAFRIDSLQIAEMLGFARRNYDAIIADLSGNLEKYSIELMNESKLVLLVVTPEVSALHLAREKLEFLRSLGLGDRVAALVNRYHRRTVINVDQIQKLLDIPIQAVFPNDYDAVNRAATAGKAVDGHTAIWQECSKLAHKLLGTDPPASRPHRRRFVEYFSISGARPRPEQPLVT